MASVAITPNPLTLPSKETGGAVNLIGMMRDDLSDALAVIGIPEKQIKRS